VQGYRQFHVNPIILILKILTVSLLFLVATGSIEVVKTAQTPDTDYVIVLDASPSMAAIDLSPSRIDAAKELSKQWLDTIPKATRVGLIVVSQDLSNIVPITDDKEVIKKAINDVEIDYAKSGTALVYALSRSVDILNKSDKKRGILLLTDGTEEIDTTTFGLMNTNNVIVYALGIGTSEQEEVDIPQEFREFYSPQEYNFTKLQELSSKTGGKAYNIGNEEEFETAFREVTLETVEIELDSSYYVVLLIAILSILELIIYSKFGGI
jgi:Mg-chelatase subunit ChlD